MAPTVGTLRLHQRVPEIPLDEGVPPRAVIELVAPVVDGGRFPAKASLGELVTVTADVFLDGHDHLDASLWVRFAGHAAPAPTAAAACHDDPGTWQELAMAPLGNDRWEAQFVPDRIGRWEYRVTAWFDRFDTWRAGTYAKLVAGVDIALERQEGVALLEEVLGHARDEEQAAELRRAVDALERGEAEGPLTDPHLAHTVRRLADRDPEAVSATMPLQVQPERARFSAWYELFPRSTVTRSQPTGDSSPTGDGQYPSEPEYEHGTLLAVEERLAYVAGMGFDVLYLPPVHPIGRAYRKGRNNTLDPGPDDVGSPWAIGAAEGGHTAVHPQLGTVDDVRRLADAARGHGLQIALDLAFQCAPDHPWVREHPDWFQHRPDGSIRYAENPPKKYQDIYPLDLTGPSWREVWEALHDVVRFWVELGITVFRVDNPHTKPFAFWEWLLGRVHADRPDVVFLAEAFTRPRVMERLAKLGFDQSYTYFAWKQSGWELREYFSDLATRTVDFLRPNAWPNTPDILTEQMQDGGRSMFALRAVLAATLCASWGVYGPAFELVEHRAVRRGSEEYLDSEKYQVRHWDLDQPNTLAPLLRTLNEIRRAHPALQHDRGLRFHGTDNDSILCYSKRDPAGTDAVLVVVNLDPRWPQAAWLDLDLDELGVDDATTYVVRDRLQPGTYRWQGRHPWARLDPGYAPAHVFEIAR